MLRKLFASSLLVAPGLAFPTDDKTTLNATSLDWTPCDKLPSLYQEMIAESGEPFFCANFSVPLDYSNEKDDRTIDLQLIKVKATKEPFKGSVLTNPGGPGGAGVDLVVLEGPAIRDDLGGYHDVIGFDPRGTGRTIPFSCLPSNITASKAKRAEYNFTIPQNDMYAELVRKNWKDGGIYAEECANTPGNADIGPYISTSFVARDMIEIIDALGEDQLQYWGISYGTVLGQTFAGMFPDRVGRLLFDSTVRFDDYHSGQWITVTRDTERTLVNFFTECVNAGPQLCPLANYTGPDTTAEDLHKAYANVFQELLDNPIYVPDDYVPSQWFQPGGNTVYLLLKYITLSLAYDPLYFGTLYTVVDFALRRDWNEAFELLATRLNTSTPETWNQGFNALHGIACGDGAFRADKPEDMYSWTQAQAAAGSFGDGFGPQVWPCAQWKFSAKERYTGPFTAINTSYPILFVNGNHDPITPLSGAYEASTNFPGSRIVVQNGHGHGVRSHPSACTKKVIADYFIDGTLPDVGKVCQTDKTAYAVYEEYAASLNVTTNSTLTKRAAVVPPFQVPRIPLFI